jgi:hypothetical protein
MWDMHNTTTEEQARTNRDSRNGKSISLEVTSSHNDVDDVCVSVESSGVVYDSTGPNDTTVGTSKCSHWGYDRCICGMAG